MGLREKRRELQEAREEREERDANPDEQWEYKALNLNFKASIAFEDEFNKLGRKGWEFVALAARDNVHRAIFKRRVQ
jgi:hypothetical protein